MYFSQQQLHCYLLNPISWDRHSSGDEYPLLMHQLFDKEICNMSFEPDKVKKDNTWSGKFLINLSFILICQFFINIFTRNFKYNNLIVRMH